LDDPFYADVAAARQLSITWPPVSGGASVEHYLTARHRQRVS